MSEANAAGLEVLIKVLEEKVKHHGSEKTPEAAREAQICALVAKYLAALDKAWEAEDEAERTKADGETQKAFEEFRRNFGRNLTVEDITSHLDGSTVGESLQMGLRMSLERLAAQG